MKPISVFLAACLLGAGVGAGAWAQAQTPTTPASGEVTKLDMPGGRVTIKHGEIKNLDMPPMTMVFRVSNPRLFDELTVGSRVRFSAEKIDGQYTVTAVSRAP